MSITIFILPISLFVLSLISCDFLKILNFFNAFKPEKYFYPLFALFTMPAPVRFPRIPSSRHELQRPESGASSNLQPLPAASGSGQQAHPPTSCLVHVPSKLPSYKTTQFYENTFFYCSIMISKTYFFDKFYLRSRFFFCKENLLSRND